MSTACFRLRRDAAFALLVSSALSTLANAQVARVQFANGQVNATAPDGSVRALARGAALGEGDTVSTEQGRAQLRFADGALVSLQPRTTFRIDEFRYQEKEDGNERGFFSLLRGGLRTITGVIGRTNRDSYRVRTSTATIGIRGTEYLAEVTNSLRVAVGGGTIAISNEAGTFIIEQGQSAFVADETSAPVITFEKPLLPPPGIAAAVAEVAQQMRSGERTDEPPCREATGTDCTTVVQPGETPQLPPAIPGVAAFGLDASLFLASGNVHLNEANEAVAFSDPETGENFQLGTTTVKNGFFDGTVGIGRWSEGTFTATVQRGEGLENLAVTVGPNQGLHYAFTTAPTSPMPGSGIALFNQLAATQATSSTGTLGLGTLTPGQGSGQPLLAVDFSTGRVGMDFNVTFPSVAYRVQTSGGLGKLSDSEVTLLGPSAPFVFANNSPVPVSGSEGACVESCKADVLGMFGGTGASRAAFTYEIVDPGAALTVHGAAAAANAGTSAPVTSSIVMAYPDDDMFTQLVGGDGTAVLAPGGRVASFSGTESGVPVTMQQQTAAFAPGEHAHDGIIGYGRLASGTATVDGGEGAGFSALDLASTQGLHYVVGVPTPAMPASGLATYALQGATKATSASGTLGLGTFSGSMAVDFALARVGLDFNVNFGGGNNYHVVTTGGVGDTANSEVFLSGARILGFGIPTTNAEACNSFCSTNVLGFFAGANAVRAGFGYLISDGGETVGGAATFTQSGVTPAPGGGSLVGESVALHYAGAHDLGNQSAGESFLVADTTGRIDSSGKLLRFSESGLFTEIGTTSMAPTESGNDGVIGWSRWTNGTLGGASSHAGLMLPGPQSLHNVFGAPTPASDMTALQAGNVTATYSLLGATKPTSDASGAVPGTLTSASLTANFGAGTVDFTANVSVNPDTYAINATGLPISGATFNGPGATTGTACASGCSASIHGFFAGAMASRAGVAYSIRNGRFEYVNGAAAFKRNP